MIASNKSATPKSLSLLNPPQKKQKNINIELTIIQYNKKDQIVFKEIYHVRKNTYRK